MKAVGSRRRAPVKKDTCSVVSEEASGRHLGRIE